MVHCKNTVVNMTTYCSDIHYFQLSLHGGDTKSSQAQYFLAQTVKPIESNMQEKKICSNGRPKATLTIDRVQVGSQEHTTSSGGRYVTISSEWNS